MKREEIAAATIGVAYVLFLAVFFVLTAATIDEVFIGLSPVLIQAILLILSLTQKWDKSVLWLTPIVLSLLFYLVWASQAVPFISKMDGQSLAVWQAILGYVLCFIALLLCSLDKPPKQKHMSNHVHHHQKKTKQESPQTAQNNEQPKQPLYQSHDSSSADNRTHHSSTAKQQFHQAQPHVVHDLNQEQHDELVDLYDEQSRVHQERVANLEAQLRQSAQYQQVAQSYLQQNQEYKKHIEKLEDELTLTKKRMEVNQENFSVTLREIEAKCKAINFVIGRVYADKKGGSQEIRDLLHIDRELYNQFSEIAAEYTPDDAEKLSQILQIILNKLAIFELPEKELFSIGLAELDVKRDESGSESVIEVLSNNDNDPIVDYYTGAKEICEKILTYINAE